MGLHGTDFKPASVSPTPHGKAHVLVLDFHTNRAQSSQPRRVLRDACVRLLQKLFTTPPPSHARAGLTALLVHPLPDPETSPTLSLVTESAALYDMRNLPTAHGRLRVASRSGAFLAPDTAPVYAYALSAALTEWVAPAASVTIVCADAAVAGDVEAAMASATGKMREAEVHFGGDAAAAQRALDEFVARVNECVVALALPGLQNDSTGRRLLLVTRPRVLARGARDMPPTELTATRLVGVDGLSEDVMCDVPRVAWAEGEARTEFETVCRAMREEGVALVCVARTEGGAAGFAVVVAGRDGLALVRGVGCADSILPVPHVVSGLEELEESGAVAGRKGEAGGLEQAGLELLAVECYNAWRLRVGGGRLGGGWEGEDGSGGNGSGGRGAVRRVNFSTG